MNTQSVSDLDELARLRTEFPGHRIWRATRQEGLPGDWVATLWDPSAGVDPTVVSETADDLRDALTQERDRVARGEKAL